jgi:GGDEF domain-containing protein
VHTDTADRVTVGRALSVGLAVLIGPTLLLYAVWQNDILVARWLAPGGLLVVVLLVWRMYRLLRTVQSQAEQLSGQARTDALTDVANRRSWDFEMTRAVQRARSSGLPFTVAMLDIDQFKAFNDAFGHQAGDEMLVACARAWSAELSAEMTLARYGGEEFALLLPGRRAQWLPTEAATDTVRRADSAMYEAKRSGRNRVVIDRAHVA